MHGYMDEWMDAAVHECADTKEINGALGYPLLTRWSSPDFLFIRGFLLGTELRKKLLRFTTF